MMDDQGAGGSPRGSDTNPEGRVIRESSLPATLLPHLYHGPQHSSFQRIAPLMDVDWPNRPNRSRSQDRGRSLPSPSHLLLQTEPRPNYDRVTLSRSLDASPVNPVSVNAPASLLPRLIFQRPLQPADVDDPPHSTVDRPPDRYSFPPVSRSSSTSPIGLHRHPYSIALPYGFQPRLQTPQPPRPPSRRAGTSQGIQDVLSEDVGVLPQPEMPIRPLGDPYAGSPGFTQEQRRGRSEVRVTNTSRAQRTQVQTQDRRMAVEHGRVERHPRDPQRQVEPFPSRSIRGTCPVFFPLVPASPVYRFGSWDFIDSNVSRPVLFLSSNEERFAD